MTGGPRYAANLAHLVDKPHAVYVVWDGDEAVYAGMTSNWLSRTAEHMHYLARGRATHIDVWEVAPDRWTAEQIETETIRDLDPRQNIQHSPSAEAAYREWRDFSACVAAGTCGPSCHPEQRALLMWDTQQAS